MTTTTKITPPLKWHGGKQYLADSIIGLMPPRCTNPNAPAADDLGWLHYVEPFFGGGAVLLANDPEGISEVVNDLNGELVNFWQTLADVERFREFARIADCIPFAQPWYEAARSELPVYSVDRAVRFFVHCRQSRAGTFKDFATLTRNRTRRGMNEQASAWLNAIEGLPAVHARLKRVVILNMDALKVIRQQDGPRTLFYLDPPYLHDTRATTDSYAHEMTDDQHIELLRVLSGIKGRFMLSGYPSELYDNAAREHGWRAVGFDLPNNAAGGDEKRRMPERLWMNYEAEGPV